MHHAPLRQPNLGSRMKKKIIWSDQYRVGVWGTLFTIGEGFDKCDWPGVNGFGLTVNLSYLWKQYLGWHSEQWINPPNLAASWETCFNSWTLMWRVIEHHRFIHRQKLKCFTKYILLITKIAASESWMLFYSTYCVEDW